MLTTSRIPFEGDCDQKVKDRRCPLKLVQCSHDATWRWFNVRSRLKDWLRFLRRDPRIECLDILLLSSRRKRWIVEIARDPSLPQPVSVNYYLSPFPSIHESQYYPPARLLPFSPINHLLICLEACRWMDDQAAETWAVWCHFSIQKYFLPRWTTSKEQIS